MVCLFSFQKKPILKTLLSTAVDRLLGTGKKSKTLSSPLSPGWILSTFLDPCIIEWKWIDVVCTDVQSFLPGAKKQSSCGEAESQEQPGKWVWMHQGLKYLFPYLEEKDPGLESKNFDSVVSFFEFALRVWVPFRQMSWNDGFSHCVLPNLFSLAWFLLKKLVCSLCTADLLLQKLVSNKKNKNPRLNGSAYTVWCYLGEAQMKITVLEKCSQTRWENIHFIYKLWQQFSNGSSLFSHI